MLDVWRSKEMKLLFMRTLFLSSHHLFLCEKKLGVDEHPRMGFLTFNGLLTCPKLTEIKLRRNRTSSIHQIHREYIQKIPNTISLTNNTED